MISSARTIVINGHFKVQMWTDEPWPWHQAHATFKHKPTEIEVRNELQKFHDEILDSVK